MVVCSEVLVCPLSSHARPTNNFISLQNSSLSSSAHIHGYEGVGGSGSGSSGASSGDWELTRAVRFFGLKNESELSVGDKVIIRSANEELSRSTFGLVCTLCEESFEESSDNARVGVWISKTAIEKCISSSFRGSSAMSPYMVSVYRFKLSQDISSEEPKSNRSRRSVDLEVPVIDLIEVLISEQYVSRGDQWRYQQMLLNRLVNQGGSLFVGMNYTFAKIQGEIRTLWSEEKEVCSGIATMQTKVVFRSKTAKYFIFVQMSEEMWQFDNTGNLLFENAVDGFLSKLFKEWAEKKCTHEVILILFSRTYFRATHLEDFAEDVRNNISHFNDTNAEDLLNKAAVFTDEDKENVSGNPTQSCFLRYLGERTAFYQDFFRLLTPSGQKRNYVCLLKLLRESLANYRDEVIPLYKKRGIGLGEGEPIPCFNSSADTGNILEAINISLNLFCNHYVDRSFYTTGQGIVVVTPGSGLFEIDSNLSLLTKNRMIDYGIRVDLICLAPPPLHIRPLFKVKDAEEFFIPHGFTQSHFSPRGSALEAPLSLTARKMTKNGHKLGQPLLQLPTLKPGELEKDSASTVIHESGDFVNFLRDLVQGTVPARTVHRSESFCSALGPTTSIGANVTNSLDEPNFRSGTPICHRTMKETALSTTPPLNFPGLSNFRKSGVGTQQNWIQSKVLLNPLKSIESQRAFQQSANRSRWMDCYPKSSDVNTLGTSTNNDGFGRRGSFSICFRTSSWSKDLNFPDLDQRHRHHSNVSQSSLSNMNNRYGPLAASMFMHSPSLTSGLTMSLSARPKEGKCQNQANDTDDDFSSPGGVNSGSRMSKCEMDCLKDHTVDIDWSSLIEVNCLPVTTSYMPDTLELDSNFSLTPSELDLESADRDSILAGRQSLTVEELYSELVTQRVLHGYQVVSVTLGNNLSVNAKRAASTLAITSPSATANDFSNRKSIGQDIVLSTFLSMGNRSHHSVERKRGYEMDTVKCVRYQYKPPNLLVGPQLAKMPQIKYKYQLKTPSYSHDSYMPVEVYFAMEDFDSMKWVAIDNHIMDFNLCPYIFEQNGVKFWRARYCLLPVWKKSVNKSFAYDCPRSDRELLDRVDKFCRFFDFINGVESIRKGATNLRLPLAETLSSQHTSFSSTTSSVPAALNTSPIQAGTTDNSSSNSNINFSPITAISSTPEKKSEALNRRKSKANVATADSDTTIITSTPNTATMTSCIDLNSSDESVLNLMINSGLVPLFDLSKKFDYVDVDTNVFKHFLAIDAVKWGHKYLPGNPSIEEVAEKFQNMLSEGLICPTSILHDTLTSDEQTYRLPPKLYTLSQKFYPGYIFYTAISPEIKLIPAGKLRGKGDRNRNVIFTYDTFETKLSFSTLPDLEEIVGDYDDSSFNLESAYDFIHMTSPFWSDYQSLVGLARDVEGSEGSGISSGSRFEIPATNFACQVVDKKNFSERYEHAFCSYNTMFHPLCGFQLEFQWLEVSGPLLSHMIKDWMRMAQKHDFLLVPIPINPFSKPGLNRENPLSVPFFVPLNVSLLPLQTQLVDNTDSSGSSVYLSNVDKMKLIILQKRILLKFDFILSSCVLPFESSIKLKLNSNPLQHIHVTGSCFCLIPNYWDVTEVRSVTAEMGLHKMHHSQIGFHCISNRLYVPPGIAITKHQLEGATSATEKLVNEFSDFCSNSVGLFWDELFNSSKVGDESEIDQNVTIVPSENSLLTEIVFSSNTVPV